MRLTLVVVMVFICHFPGICAGQTTLLELTQSKPREMGKLKLPAGHKLGPIIPGLSEGGVPQGLAYLKDQDGIAVSSYFDGGQPSMISILSNKTGKLIKSLTLLDQNGAPHTGHVGGIAVSKKYLWVGSDRLYRIPLSSVAKAKSVDELRLDLAFPTESKTAFLTCAEQVLWVGEFVLDNDPNANPAHHLRARDGGDRDAWVSGYALDAQDDPKAKALAPNQPLPPDSVLAVRSKVQGMAFFRNQICLSISYGRNNASKLTAFKNPLKEPPHKTVNTQNGAKVKVWFLDGQNRIKEMNFPPMSEGIASTPNGYAVICESGATKYRKGAKHQPLDYLVQIPAP